MIEVADITNIEDYENIVICGDCIEVMKRFPDNFIDACVTDPPYGLEFMGKEWDSFKETGNSRLFHSPDRESARGFGAKDGGTPIRALPRFAIDMHVYQEWCRSWALELFRVMKPGAYLLAFGATRTYHRLACAIEDAGFEIVDSVHYLYGVGFPKGHNIRKGMERKFFFERMSKSERAHYDSLDIKEKAIYVEKGIVSSGIREEVRKIIDDIGLIGDPNTALKPAHEPIVLAQKTREGTYVNNVLKWGVGAMNIDGCRVAVNPDVDTVGKTTDRGKRITETWEEGSGFKNEQNQMAGVLPSGRYPANLILSHSPECKLIKSGKQKISSKERDRFLKTGEKPFGHHGIYGDGMRASTEIDYDDSEPEVWACVEGCPVRTLNEQSGNSKSSPVGFKGVAWKHSGNTKDEMTPLEWQRTFNDSGGAARFFYCAKPSTRERNAGLNGERNAHITVKPISLIRYLVRLITPRGGVVFDPFLGSGTTAIAAENEGCRWFGCDISKEYCEIAEKRIAALGGDEDDGYEQELLVK
jgi:DNA modification methylase